MENERPDPDQLLADVQAREAAARRGRLRIYFGASAGVGKTYAMLTGARALRNEGRDVVVGVVETHARAETEALIAGLPILPRASIAYEGRTLQEFDVDGALARKPQLILVDELAHTNVPGSRHAKRWQDIDELQAAGIDVFTTLNVQHLESLNDVVGGITGVTGARPCPISSSIRRTRSCWSTSRPTICSRARRRGRCTCRRRSSAPPRTSSARAT